MNISGAVKELSIPDNRGTKTQNIEFKDLFAPSSTIIPLGDERFHDIEFVPKFDMISNGFSNEIIGINRKIGIKNISNLSDQTGMEPGFGPESSLRFGSERSSGSFLLTPSQAVKMMSKSAVEWEPGSVSGICLAANVAAVCVSDPIGFAAVEALALYAALNKVMQLLRMRLFHFIQTELVCNDLL